MSFMKGNSSEEIILKSLQEPRLDHFAKILAFLSRLDRLSGKTADCFRVLDELSNAYNEIYEKKKESTDRDLCRSLAYGVPVLNPENSLGLGVWYWSFDDDVTSSKVKVMEEVQSAPPRWLALFDIKEKSGGQGGEKGQTTISLPGSVQDEKVIVSSLRYTQDWVKFGEANNSITWSDPEPLTDSPAHLIIRLDPPVIISEVMAMKLGVVLDEDITNSSSGNIRHSPILNGMNQRVGETSRTIHNPDSSTTSIDISYANLLPYSLVEVSEIPVNHPRDVESIFNSLRSFLILRKVWTSLDDLLSFNMVKRGKGINRKNNSSENSHYYSNDGQPQDEQLSFADAIMEYEIIEKSNVNVAGGSLSAIVNLTTNESFNNEDNGSASLTPIINIGISLFQGISFNISPTVNADSVVSLKVDIQNSSNNPIPASLAAKVDKLNKVLNITEDLGIFLSVLQSL